MVGCKRPEPWGSAKEVGVPQRQQKAPSAEGAAGAAFRRSTGQCAATNGSRNAKPIPMASWRQIDSAGFSESLERLRAPTLRCGRQDCRIDYAASVNFGGPGQPLDREVTVEPLIPAIRRARCPLKTLNCLCSKIVSDRHGCCCTRPTQQGMKAITRRCQRFN
jgi:hypothetical protein